jgi:hypothetical protein
MDCFFHMVVYVGNVRLFSFSFWRTCKSVKFGMVLDPSDWRDIWSRFLYWQSPDSQNIQKGMAMAGSLFWTRVICILADRFSNRLVQKVPLWRVVQHFFLTFLTDWPIGEPSQANLAYVCRYKDPHIAVNPMKDILAQSELAGSKTRLAVSAIYATYWKG